ncbi:L-2,4-diaminobutyrate decarboxylase [Fulvia fulva]|nr:L-2,4-diaminobutyrate decarboxylase [Fulvia fulva]
MAEEYVLPAKDIIDNARTKLLYTVPTEGLGEDAVKHHLETHIAPALNRQSQSPTYYGFVTGGATPAAKHADHLAVEHDQNVQVHLPNDTICTDVEDAALRMVCDLLRLDHHDWQHRTFTTGATASNIVGLACGREYVIREAAKRKGKDVNAYNISERGLFTTMLELDLSSIQILTTAPHSSLRKAASILGLGRESVQDLGLYQTPHNFDFNALEAALQKPNTASIIVVSCAEVNTGFFATSGNDMHSLRSLATKYNAWTHIDAAVGLPARFLPSGDNTLSAIYDGVKDIELADSITGDAHKLFNVPYDCGIFLSRHLGLGMQVFQNVGAAYLATGLTSSVPSPLNIAIENSRRFRALPVYATLAAYGRSGLGDTLKRQIALARSIAQFIASEPGFEILPRSPPSFNKVKEQGISRIYIVVLFRATDDALNKELVQRINATRKIFVSGTQWDGQPAARFALSNWQVDVERDMALITEVLRGVLKD